MATPSWQQWLTGLVSPLAYQVVNEVAPMATPYLFPNLPSGASNPQTQAVGIAGAAYGGLPSANGTVPNPGGAYGGGTINPLLHPGTPPPGGIGTQPKQSAKSASLQTAPSLQTVAPLASSSVIPLQTATANGPMSTPAPTTTAPAANYTGTNPGSLGGGVDAGAIIPKGYDSSGNYVNAQVTDAERYSSGNSPQDMIDNGYTFDPNSRTWTLNSSSSTSKSWYGNYGSTQVGGGARAPIFIGDFRTEQAYQTWMNRRYKNNSHQGNDNVKPSGYVTGTTTTATG